jgi:hypothetical protein
MPLLRGIARTAVIAGTATHVSNNVNRRQQGRWQRQEEQSMAQAPAPEAAAPAATEVDPIERLKQLGQLRDQGILTEEEFAAQKAKLLG